MKEGWEIRSLEEIADQCLGKMLDKAKNRGEMKPYLRNLNVRWFEFDLSEMLEMRFEESERERYTATKGDLLICEGGYPGRAAIWPFDEPVYFQKAIHRVRFHEPETAKWFLYYLHLCDSDGSLRDHFTGSGIQHFTGEALRRFRLPLPPLSEQRQIVAILDKAREQTKRLQHILQEQLESVTELNRSLSQKAFAGTLTNEHRSEIVGRLKQPIVNTAAAGFGANILAIAFEKHKTANREKSFGHVKAQKFLHLAEAIAGIDLGRDPIKDAAGPNDFDHMRRVEYWAEQRNFFKFHKVDGRYHFQKLPKYAEGLALARADVKAYTSELERILDLLVPMDTQEAEVLATVHAAWNNLLLDGELTTDDAIVRAARDDWHADKLSIPKLRFVEAIKLIRQKKIVPDGTAKRVRDKYLI